jgi:hypothetical protein
MPRKSGVRRKRRPQGGKGLVDVLKKIHNFVKEKKLISRGAAAFAPLAGRYGAPITAIGNAASSLGYGKKRRRKYKR